jgi:CheY-like chemotaxis protein
MAGPTRQPAPPERGQLLIVVAGKLAHNPRHDDGAAMTDPRVVLAEDDVLLREGLASLLERSGFEVTGQAGDAAGLLALVDRETPDLVVVDIRMPPSHTTEGLEAARRIRQEHPEIGILVLSAHVEVSRPRHGHRTARQPHGGHQGDGRDDPPPANACHRSLPARRRTARLVGG